MPRYNYYCEECAEYFELVHSMTELVEDCIACESPQFTRVPSIPTYVQKEKTQTTETKTGSLVEEYIKKNKKSVQEEKKRLKNQEYKG
jgi:putative FmdB family regulatory protein